MEVGTRAQRQNSVPARQATVGRHDGIFTHEVAIMKRASVLLADSHELFRLGLGSLLQRQHGIEVVGEGGDIPQVRRLVASLKPDVLLIDPDMPGSQGLSTVLQITATSPQTRVGLLTTSTTDREVLAAVEAGIQGFLLKDIGLDELVHAIWLLHAGDAYYSGKVCAKVLRQFSDLARRREVEQPRGLATLHIARKMCSG